MLRHTKDTTYINFPIIEEKKNKAFPNISEHSLQNNAIQETASKNRIFDDPEYQRK